MIIIISYRSSRQSEPLLATILISIHANNVDKRGSDGKFKVHSTAKVPVPKNVTTVQFLVWAYGVSYATFKRWKVEESKWTKKVAAHAGKSVLTDEAFAQTIYTPERMFMTSKMTEWYESQRVQSRRVDPQAKRNHRNCLKINWTRLSAEVKFHMRKCLVITMLDSP